MDKPLPRGCGNVLPDSAPVFFWEAGTVISILDIGFGIVILLFLVRGLLRGMIKEISGFIGLFLGLILAGRFYPLLVPQFEGVIESERWAAGASYLVIFVTVLILVGLCAAVARRFLKVTPAAWLDNLLGACIGAFKGVLVNAVVLAFLLRFAQDSPFLKNSELAGYLSGVAGFVQSLMPAFLA